MMLSDRPIVVVEDDEKDMSAIVEGLSRCVEPNAIIKVSGGNEAVNTVTRRCEDEADDSERPSVVVVDLDMQQTVGREILRELKERPETKFIPIVALVPSSNEQSKKDAYDLQANACVAKPPSREAFIMFASKIAAFWVKHNERPRRIKLLQRSPGQRGASPKAALVLAPTRAEDVKNA